MAYKYKHFTPQNIAPKGTRRIVAYKDGKEVCGIPLGGLTPPNGEPLYSFGLVSDIHLFHLSSDWNPNAKFDNALSYFEDRGCDFCVVCGDLTQTGLYLRTVENDPSTTYADDSQMAKYKEICDRHPNLPVYEIAGNHESYYSMPISDNLAKWEEYTGKNILHYAVEHKSDVFIFCGQSRGSVPITDEAFAFLSDTLSANSKKRCFVFVHPIWRDDSGDANGVYVNESSAGGPLLSYWSRGEELKTLLAQHSNTILFHGHTHIKFEEQKKDKNLNYTTRNGFKSVHIPSLSRPRDIIDGALKYAPSESQGYIVDVYEDCIVLNGMDLINNIPVPLGTYQIDTTL